MKALSIRQPWAWCILYGGKRVENRTWPTRFRGPIYIHAGLKYDKESLRGIEDVIEAWPKATRPPAVCGALAGTATIVDCVSADDVPPEQREWVTGPWCFILENVIPLAEPIPYKGALGFFDVVLPTNALRPSALQVVSMFGDSADDAMAPSLTSR
jgi:hypothetical protein